MRSVLPTLDGEDTSPAAGFERPPVLRAGEILPPGLSSGPHHAVDEHVTTDGFIHLYTIHSDYGTFEAHGDEMLRRRVLEIEALARLDEMRKRTEFAGAMAKAIQSPFVATWNLVRHPVDSITGLPADAWKAIQRASQLARAERSEYEESALREFIGFEKRKREIAHRLGVDPYSSNRVLQRELNRFAWAAYAGGLPALFVPFDEREAESAKPEPEAGDERIREILLDYSPEDLRRLNRIELAVMGIPPPLRDAFIGHPWYSPRHETVLVESLAGLDLAANRSAFIEVALGARSEDDALFYQRAAELIRAYNDRVRTIERIVPLRRTVGGYTSDGTLVVPLLVDHAVWSRPTARFASSLSESVPASVEVRRTELLLSGTLSAKARSEIEHLGIAVTEDAFERLSPRQAGGAGVDP